MIAPDAMRWLDLPPGRRRALARAAHPDTSDRLHPAGYRPDLHAALHVVVEDWIAKKEPAAVAATVERLTAEGLRRHAALHAVIDAALPHMTGSTEALEAALQDVTAAAYIATRL